MSEPVEIIPLYGIRIGGRSVTLGESKGCVERDLGLPSYSNADRCSFFEGALCVGISTLGRVETIAFPFGSFSELLPTVYGKSVFGEPADEIRALLKEKNGGDLRTDGSGRSCCFPALGIRLYRDAVPEDVQRMIRAARAANKPMRPEEIAFERDRAARWDLIELSEKDYCEKYYG